MIQIVYSIIIVLLVLPSKGWSEISFKSFLKEYRQGEMSSRKAWIHIDSLLKQKYLTKSEKSNLYQIQSRILYTNKYYLLAVQFAVKSILSHDNYLSKNVKGSWRILYRVSSKHDISYLIEDLFNKNFEIKSPPYFGSDWFYYLGIDSYIQGNKKEALRYLSLVSQKGRFYQKSQFHQAIINYEMGDYKKSISILKRILDPFSSFVGTSSDRKNVEVKELAKITIARIYYEMKDFRLSSEFYELIDKRSDIYYEALFERSWAYFMSGRVRESLGSLYSLESPYFSDHFNPESKILESIIYYWVCRYEEARNALAFFMDHHKSHAQGLQKFLNQQLLTDEKAYNLFENTISGVTPESIGISDDILKEASNRGEMKQVREVFADLLDEYNRLEIKGFLNSKRISRKLDLRLKEVMLSYRQKIGHAYINELKALSEHFQTLDHQAEFLYLELLLGQKEHILGREIHSESKIKNTKLYATSESGLTQTWKSSKSEYWWDEIGNQIVNVESVCN